MGCALVTIELPGEVGASGEREPPGEAASCQAGENQKVRQVPPGLSRRESQVCPRPP